MDTAAKSGAAKGGFVLKKSHVFFLVVILATLATYVIPKAYYFAYPLVVIATLAHELAHGMSGILGGLHFTSLSITADGGATVQMAGSATLMQQALMSAAGLIGPLLFAALCYLLCLKPFLARIALTLMAVGLIMGGFLVFQGTFTLVLTGVLAAFCLILAQQPSPVVAQCALGFLAVQMNLSIFARHEYLSAPVLNTDGDLPSDVNMISEALFFPPWFWAALIGVFAIAVLAMGAILFIRKT